MPFRKLGTGRITRAEVSGVPGPEEETITAVASDDPWSEQEEAALAAENEDDGLE